MGIIDGLFGAAGTAAKVANDAIQADKNREHQLKMQNRDYAYKDAFMNKAQGFQQENMKLNQGFQQENMRLNQQLGLETASKMPSAQVQGMVDAGINPMLSMGSAGQGTPGTAAMAANPRSLSNGPADASSAQQHAFKAMDKLVSKAVYNDLKKL